MIATIVDYLRMNSLSSTEVADALGKSGWIKGISAVNPTRAVGPVYYTYACSGTNWHLHKQLEELPPGQVVYVDSFNCDGKAIFGHLVTKYIIEKRHAVAVVVNGLVRDYVELISDRYPIWATGTTPIGVMNRFAEKDVSDNAIDANREAFQGIMVCDQGGVVLINRDKVTDDTLSKLAFIREQERIWYECLEQGMSTFEIVCEKKYLSGGK